MNEWQLHVINGDTQLGYEEWLAAQERKAPRAPNGQLITGTLEIVKGRGAIKEGSLKRCPNTGELNFEYAGGTDIFWDEQNQVERNGKRIFLDEDGNEWNEDQLLTEGPVDITKLKPSELLELALADLEKVEADPRYIVNMTARHYPIDGRCYVCLAGAVLAKTLETPPDWRVTLTTTPMADDLRKALGAIDHFRVGRVDRALETLGYEGVGCKKVAVFQYEYARPELFKNGMKEIVYMLRKRGL